MILDPHSRTCLPCSIGEGQVLTKGRVRNAVSVYKARKLAQGLGVMAGKLLKEEK